MWRSCTALQLSMLYATVVTRLHPCVIKCCLLVTANQAHCTVAVIRMQAYPLCQIIRNRTWRQQRFNALGVKCLLRIACVMRIK